MFYSGVTSTPQLLFFSCRIRFHPLVDTSGIQALKIATVKRYDFKEFMKFMCLHDYRATSWMGGFYYNLTEIRDPIKWNKNSALLLYEGLSYAEGQYSPFLIVHKKMNIKLILKNGLILTILLITGYGYINTNLMMSYL